MTENPPDEFRVRDYRDSDAERMAEVFFRSVREVAGRDYSAEQVHAWAPARPDPSYFEAYASDGRRVFVVVDASDTVVAYADLESNGHIDHLYRHPDADGRGVATMLYLALVEAAEDLGVDRLFVEASEPARRFFEHHGFTVLRRRDFERSGVPLHNYAMEKRLI